MHKYTDFHAALVKHFWDYRQTSCGDAEFMFDGHQPPAPPVFCREHADSNLLTRPSASLAETERVRSAIPVGKRHRWFGSMKSSQALAQSVFANLQAYGKLGLLAGIVDGEGDPVFVNAGATDFSATFEYDVDYLGEPRPTSVDVLLDDGAYRVFVECKLTESHLGPCSQPKGGSCAGVYHAAPYPPEGCALTVKGVTYWCHIPALFCWHRDEDYSPCPICAPFQLVRNVLAACVRPSVRADPEAGHAVLLFDARNPHFAPGGDIHNAYQSVRGALKYPSLIRLCTWQQVIAAIGNDPEMDWLAEALRAKYGF